MERRAASGSGFLEDPALPSDFEGRAWDPKTWGVHSDEGIVRRRAAYTKRLSEDLRAAGQRLLLAGGTSATDGWRDLALQLGASTCTDPPAAAAAIRAALRAEDRRTVVLVTEGRSTRWGSDLCRELKLAADSTDGFLILVLIERASASSNVRKIPRDNESAAKEARLWVEPNTGTGDDATASAANLSLEEQRLVRRIALCQRSLSEWDVAQLDPEGVAEGLLQQGVLTLAGARWVRLGWKLDTPASEDAKEDVSAAARLLETLRDDPWAQMRAAELHAGVGQIEKAQEAAACALRAVIHVTVRRDFWERYARVLDGQREDVASAGRDWASELAVRMGDFEHALSFARAAVDGQRETYSRMLTIGWAARMCGHAEAGEALSQALPLACGSGEKAAVDVQMAEIQCEKGDHSEAKRLAEKALLHAGDASTRLAARAVLGKLHFVAKRWSDAERHYSADAQHAARAGSRPSNLRARLNLALVLAESLRFNEAHVTLLAVAEDGRRHSDFQAVWRAEHHLAIMAHRANRYAEAMRRYEEVHDYANRRGESTPIAIINRDLAELRIDVGLFDQAQDALRFGRSRCDSLAGRLVADYGLLEARIYLAQHRSDMALEAVATALKHASSSVVADAVLQCHLLNAEIALGLGKAEEAKEALDRAETGNRSGWTRAQLELLRARLARATGVPFADAAKEARAQAENVGSPKRILAAESLLARACLDCGDNLGARAHIAAAAEKREFMAHGLLPEIRERFFATRDLAELARLEAEVEGDRGTPPASTATGRDEGLTTTGEAKARYPPRPAASNALEEIIGDDPVMVELKDKIVRFGPCEEPVAILGETGSGKDLVARALHDVSRRGKPFVPVNCANLSTGTLQSLFFGHEKGAFTDAKERHQGYFERAKGGTLFLDEIGDAPLEVQGILLRVLQDGAFERQGGTTSLRADCRIICATHCNLESLIDEGKLRKDFYYRIMCFMIEVPPLRQRLGDLRRIAEKKLRELAKLGQPAKQLGDDALVSLCRYGWPGNVRELERALTVAHVHSGGRVLRAEDFRFPNTAVVSKRTDTRHVENARSIPHAQDDAGISIAAAAVETAWKCVLSGEGLPAVNERVEQGCLHKALVETGGNINRAATLLQGVRNGTPSKPRLGYSRARVSQLVRAYWPGGWVDDSAASSRRIYGSKVVAKEKK
jgi:DNA-binding NtrC family response regulator/tetratricopeptide (TPR) repeat protein